MIVILILLAGLGLCFGSFINALVWRLHEQSKKQSKHSRSGLSISKGRSMCVHCGHTLAWYDLVPVLSWISLAGKCRYCKRSISLQYPAVELFTATLFVASYILWPQSSINIYLLSIWLFILTGLISLLVFDFKWMLLPNKIVYPLIGLSVLFVISKAIIQQDISVVYSAFWGLVSLGGLFYVLFQVSNGTWIGGGDVKLGFALGLLVGGFIEGLMVLFLASVLGTVFALTTQGMGKKALSKRIPFGPFLIIATIAVFLFSTELLNWYSTQIILV